VAAAAAFSFTGKIKPKPVFMQPFNLTKTFLFTSLLFVFACKKQDTVVPPDDPTTPDSPAQGLPTSVGQPIGPALTATIGPAGGSVSGTYARMMSGRGGSFQLHFPPGAFTQNVTVQVQPIENMCHQSRQPAFRISATGGTAKLNKPAELVITPNAAPTPNEPEIMMAFQDPVIKVWKGQRGTKEAATGKRSFKITRLADWALFPDYQLAIEDYSRHSKMTDSVNGEIIALLVAQPVHLRVVRFVEAPSQLPQGGDDELFQPLAAPVTIANDQVGNVKWKFNGVPVTGNQALPNQPNGQALLRGLKQDSLEYIAPRLLPGNSSLDVRLEAEVRGNNNGPVVIMIQRFQVSNKNEYQFGGSNIVNAIGNAVGSQAFLSISLRRSLNTNDLENINCTSVSAALPKPYPFTAAFDGVNAAVGVTGNPAKSYDHYYTDRQGVKHWSGGDFTISEIRTFSRYKIYVGTINSSLYRVDPITRDLHTLGLNGKFAIVDMQ
jgi:hypothetical protein